MKPTSLSQEFLNQLFNEIKGYEYMPESDDDNCRDMELQIGDLSVYVSVVFDVVTVDDSFDHCFGTEEGCHFESGSVIDLEDVTITDENDKDLSDLFDKESFMMQF